MKIFNINLDPEMFSFKEGIIGGDECILITPNDIKCKWTEDTLKFRSMIVRKSDHKIISRGFDKFFNWAEHPEIDIFPDGEFEIIQKVDGSLIIWGQHNGELIHRTRGTFDASNMKNGDEIQFLINKYPKLIEAIYVNLNYSILTEWETRSNIIVIGRVLEPTLTLVGVIDNNDGILITQEDLDRISSTWGLERPIRYYYKTISECLNDVELWVGLEGVVAYSKNGQSLRKCKSDWYRSLHALATGVRSVSQVLDVFMTSSRFINYQDFYDYITQTKDHEIAEKCKDFISQITNAYAEYLKNIEQVKKVVDNIRGESFTRKDQALEIVRHYDGWKKTAAFQLLDNMEVDDKIIRKAIETYL